MIPTGWLTTRIHTPDLEVVQARELRALGLSDADRARLASRGPSPRWREQWDRFIAAMADGDELWAFESPPESHETLSGAAGYAIVRDGAPIATLASRRS